MSVPPQLRIMLLVEANLVKKVLNGGVCGHGDDRIRTLRDGIWKDVNRALSVLNATPGKKISKIINPA